MLDVIVTDHNRLAVQAAEAVIQSPGADLNPLLLYGQSGVGKTHLLTSIATAASVVVVDDAHHLRPGEARRLVAAAEGRQVVLAARRIGDELRALAMPGLAVEIRPPDAQTRLKIMCRTPGVSVEIARCIAGRDDLSFGEQLNMLRQAEKRSRLSGCALSSDLVASVLDDLAPKSAPPAPIDRITETVADHFGVQAADLRGTSRTRALAEARHVAIFLCRDLTNYSLLEVGAAFGGRDATTVMHSEHKIRRLIEVLPDLNDRIAAITAELRR